MAIVKDFWAEPAYADLLLPMQERIHDYVIAGKGSAQDALDGLVEDWTEVLEDEGKLLSIPPTRDAERRRSASLFQLKPFIALSEGAVCAAAFNR